MIEEMYHAILMNYDDPLALRFLLSKLELGKSRDLVITAVRQNLEVLLHCCNAIKGSLTASFDSRKL